VAKTQFFGANARKTRYWVNGANGAVGIKKTPGRHALPSLIAVLQISLTQLDQVYFAKATQRY
jgi:hypothetical protein